MTDAREDDDSHDLVRRLLAEARADEPVPDHVSARLDETLAELLAERAQTPQAGAQTISRTAETQVPLPRRRRRLLVGLGVAAALVVAAGVALPSLLDSPEGDTTDLAAAGPLALRSATAEETVQTYVANRDTPVATVAPPARVPLNNYRTDSDEPAAGSPPQSDSTESDSTEDGEFAAGVAGAPPTCAEPGEGEVVAATYDGKPALLVLTGLEGDVVLAQVLLCDTGSAPTRVSAPATVFTVPQP